MEIWVRYTYGHRNDERAGQAAWHKVSGPFYTSSAISKAVSEAVKDKRVRSHDNIEVRPAR